MKNHRVGLDNRTRVGDCCCCRLAWRLQIPLLFAYDVDVENMKEHRNQEKESPGDGVMAGVVLEKRPKKMSGCAMTSI